MAHILIAAALAAATPGAFPAPAPAFAPALPATVLNARPAIWVVNDADTVIYLFGTFHALDGKSAWFNEEVRTAFAASDELVLETIVPEGPPLPSPSGSEVPSPSSVPSVAMTPSASFLATARLAISAGRSRGMKVDDGADVILRRAAEASGKPIEGLETMAFQVGMFGRMPEQTAPAATVTQDRHALADLSLVMGQMQAAWNRGDPAIFAAMLTQMRLTSPRNYDVMFAQRNSNWAHWIAERLLKPGIVFVAVGTGHLTGPDSVQVKLAQLGVASERIN
ncbi:MAG: TraB/GumN family protein [Sphingomicrobium sp.]